MRPNNFKKTLKILNKNYFTTILKSNPPLEIDTKNLHPTLAKFCKIIDDLSYKNFNPSIESEKINEIFWEIEGLNEQNQMDFENSFFLIGTNMNF